MSDSSLSLPPMSEPSLPILLLGPPSPLHSLRPFQLHRARSQPQLPKSDSPLFKDGLFSYLHRSGTIEIVLSIPQLLQKVLLVSEQCNSSRFRILYYNDGIVTCLYTSSRLETVYYLIALDIQKGERLLVEGLDNTEKIFVRYNSSFFYYSTYSEENHFGHKKWTLRGYCFEDQKWFGKRIFLGCLNGCEIGATICFEIINGYFYALSNQTNYDVEEVDWTLFYHCVRFPVASPSKSILERTHLDESMWRRQHSEGPLDDCWGNLALKLDKATDKLKIVEIRREFLFGAVRSQRTYYTTELVFPRQQQDEAGNTCIPMTEVSSFINRVFDKYRLASIANNQLALTLKPRNNPYWLPMQTRPLRNMHQGDDGCYIFPQMYLQYYNSTAETYLDLIDNLLVDKPYIQHLQLCIGSCKLNLPAKKKDSVLIREKNRISNIYTACPVAFWLSEQDLKDCRLTDLINPPSHLGNIEATRDERSVVYTTGSKNTLSTLMFISFDLSIKLSGLKDWQGHEQPHLSEGIPFIKRSSIQVANIGPEGWIWKEPAMYHAIDKGYYFGIRRKPTDSEWI